MSTAPLSEDLVSTIQQKIEEGDSFLDDEQYEQAERLYRQATDLIPEPKLFHEVSLDAYIALGEALFWQLRFQEALEAFQQASVAPGGSENPLTYFRLGQAHYHLGNEAAATDTLGRAVLLGGEDFFEGEDNEEYREIVAPLLDSGQKSE